MVNWLLASMALLFLVGVILFRDVDHQERRLLQNMVFRLYRFWRWGYGLVRAIDAGVLEYYQTIDDSAIEPLNEKRYAPTVQRMEPQKQGEAETQQLQLKIRADLDRVRAFGRTGA